jgi:hypothetical protein
MYPIAAIKFGRDYLIVGGFLIEKEEDVRLFAEAIDAFCNWMSVKYGRTSTIESDLL